MYGELYPYVQAAVYHADGLWGQVTFDLYLRNLPEGVGYAVAAGVDEALDDILDFRVPPEAIAWLKVRPEFEKVAPVFFTSLQKLRFTGDVDAVPEGTVVFPLEPLLRVTAPLSEAVFLETFLLQKVGFATAVATCATRMTEAVRGRSLLDVSMRRWFSHETALAASRAAWIGGFDGTSNMGAALLLGIEPAATLGGTFLAAYDTDVHAFEAFHLHFPRIMQLILPEEDPRESIARFAHLGGDVRFFRVQHPNLALAVRLVRDALDETGLKKAKILVSGDLDATEMERLVQAGVPVDSFAVSGALGNEVAPLARSLIWRLAERTKGGAPEPARGPTSSYFPGRKQVLRFRTGDLVCLEREAAYLATPGSLPLLSAGIRSGKRVRAAGDLEQARRRRAVQVSLLPAAVRRLVAPDPWNVQASESLAALTLA